LTNLQFSGYYVISLPTNSGKHRMKVRTEHIKDTVRQFVFREAAESFPVLASMVQAGECRFNGPVSVELNAGREMDHYRVEGTLSAPVSLVCSRCLAEFDRVVSSQFTIFSVKEPVLVLMMRTKSSLMSAT